MNAEDASTDAEQNKFQSKGMTQWIALTTTNVFVTANSILFLPAAFQQQGYFEIFIMRVSILFFLCLGLLEFWCNLEFYWKLCLFSSNGKEILHLLFPLLYLYIYYVFVTAPDMKIPKCWSNRWSPTDEDCGGVASTPSYLIKRSWVRAS